jgi:hypothetical protein
LISAWSVADYWGRALSHFLPVEGGEERRGEERRGEEANTKFDGETHLPL